MGNPLVTFPGIFLAIHFHGIHGGGIFKLVDFDPFNPVTMDE
jgi:hypothetical protein